MKLVQIVALVLITGCCSYQPKSACLIKFCGGAIECVDPDTEIDPVDLLDLVVHQDKRTFIYSCGIAKD